MLPNCFPRWLCPLLYPPATSDSSSHATAFPTLVLSVLWITLILVDVKCYLFVVLIYIFPVTVEAEHLFMGILSIVYLPWRNGFSNSSPIFKLIFISNLIRKTWLWWFCLVSTTRAGYIHTSEAQGRFEQARWQSSMHLKPQDLSIIPWKMCTQNLKIQVRNA